jgi:vitamin B12 transporter
MLELHVTHRHAHPVTLAATLAALIQLPALAAEPDAAAKTDETIVVTADRQPETIDKTTTSVDVVDQDGMRRQGFATKPLDYLRLVPGLDRLDSAGGIDGGIAQIRLRGAASQADTQILVDGVPMIDVTATNGSPNLSQLMFPALSSIEVVRGSQSGLYGSHSVGGVVNFISARPTAQPHGDAVVEYGSFDTCRVAGAATGPIPGAGTTGGGKPVVGYALGVDGIASHGFSTQTTRSDGKPDGFEPDGVRKLGASARVVANPDDRVSIYGSGSFSDVYQAYDGFGDANETDFHTAKLWRLGGGGDVALPGLATANLDYAHTRSIRHEHAVFGDLSYTGDDDFVGAKVGVPLGSLAEVAVGIDADHQAALTGSLDHESQMVGGAYAKGTLSHDAYDLDAVLRRDHTSRKEDATTYRLGAAWSPLDRRIRLHGAYGTAFRAPSLDEQFGVYDFGGSTFVGNPDLQPQQSRSWEAGLDLKPGHGLLLGSTYFDSTYRRRIVSVFDPTFTNGTLVNEGSASRIHGLENEVSWDEPAMPVAVHGTYTWQDSRDDAGEHFVLLPDQKAALDLTVRGGGAWLTVGADAVGPRLASNATHLPGYVTLHAAAGYALTSHLAVYARGENLLDKGHAADSYDAFDPITFASVPYYYTSMPRAVFAGIEGSF